MNRGREDNGDAGPGQICTGLAMAPPHMEAAMKILFYLPVITPWWFDHVIAPMLRA